jgi:hypothetical protein
MHRDPAYGPTSRQPPDEEPEPPSPVALPSPSRELGPVNELLLPGMLQVLRAYVSPLGVASPNLARGSEQGE